MGALVVAASGSNIDTGAASASAAIPNDSTGSRARFVRVAVTVAAYVKLGQTGVTAAAADMLVNPEQAVVLKVDGFTHIAAIQVSAAGVCNVTPLEAV